jgi:hypothetical protein
MRAEERPRLCAGDRVMLSTGLYAGIEVQVIEVRMLSPLVGRARLRLSFTDDYWLPFWTEPHDVTAQAGVDRDFFRGPDRRGVIDPAWLDWQGGLIPHLARHIAEERCFAEMAVLADALEDAGCRDDSILAHCRRGGLHVRGCWVLDALSGR